MTINKIKLIELKDIWPWALTVLIPTLAAAQAIRYNYWSTDNGIAPWGWVVFTLVLTAFWGTTLYRYILRYLFIKNIMGYTKDGTAVTLSKPTIDRAKNVYGAANYVNSILTLVNTTMEDALSFWNIWATKNLHTQQTIAIFNGIFLAIEDKPMVVRFFSQKLAGLEIGNQIAVIWLTNNPSDLIGIIRHETGHLCLNAMGYGQLSDEAQHAMMDVAGF